jgi:hypothetical protein
LLETALPVVGWIERCSYPDADEPGDWLADDALAGTLSNVLEVMGRDGVSSILAAVRAVEDWADGRPADLARLPRAVGMAEASLRGSKLLAAARPFTLLSLQRVHDAYRALGAGDRARVDAAVADTGQDELLGHRSRHRLEKQGFQLAFATG